MRFGYERERRASLPEGSGEVVGDQLARIFIRLIHPDSVFGTVHSAETVAILAREAVWRLTTPIGF